MSRAAVIGVPAREELYPIRTVAALTGIKPVTLRAWERRHGLVCPQRAASGHRLYSRADLDRLREVVSLIEQGVPIRHVRERLEALRPEPHPVPDPATRLAAGAQVWEACTRRMLDAVARFDEARLDAIYNEALTLYPIDLVHEQVVCPLMGLLGERWSHQHGGIAEEHFFTGYLRNKLGARLHHRALAAHGRVLLTACMPDERHDLGLLTFCHGASARGYRVVMLGADLPLTELPPAVRQADADALVLAMVMPPAKAVLNVQLPALVRAVQVPVLIGGRCAHAHAVALEHAGAVVLGHAVQDALARLDALLGAVHGVQGS